MPFAAFATDKRDTLAVNHPGATSQVSAYTYVEESPDLYRGPAIEDGEWESGRDSNLNATGGSRGTHPPPSGTSAADYEIGEWDYSG